jgi:hypothetical protein
MPAVTSRARRTTAPEFETRKRPDEQRYWVERTATTQAYTTWGQLKPPRALLAPMLLRPAQASAPKPSFLGAARAVAYLYGRWAKRGLTL